MLINGRHTHCLHVPFLFHWQIYGQQPSSTSSPRDKRKKAEWTSKKQTSVDDVKNKTSILNRITIVFHHCVSLIWTFPRKQITYKFDDLFEIHEAFRRGLIWKNASQIQFHQFYNLLRDVCYKKLPCTWVAFSAVLTPFYFWKHLDIVRHIEFKNAFPQIRSRERKFEQRLVRGLFWSRL